MSRCTCWGSPSGRVRGLVVGARWKASLHPVSPRWTSHHPDTADVDGGLEQPAVEVGQGHRVGTVENDRPETHLPPDSATASGYRSPLVGKRGSPARASYGFWGMVEPVAEISANNSRTQVAWTAGRGGLP